MDESAEDEEMDESAEDEEMDEAAEEELEDSYMMDAEHDGMDDHDATDKLGMDVMDMDDEGPKDDEHGHEGQEDEAIYKMKDAIAELEAAFEKLEAAQGEEESEMDSEFDDEEGEETDEMMGMHEGKRITREYVEKVGNDWEKGSTQKQQGKIVGANTGEKMPTANDATHMKWGEGKPESPANAKNLNQGATEKQHNTGTKPNAVNKGVTPEKSGNYTGKDWETNSSPGGKAGVKNLKKVSDAYGLAGGSKNNGSEGSPVGAGSGDNSVKGSTNTKAPVRQFKK
jgi:hypothetical protein